MAQIPSARPAPPPTERHLVGLRSMSRQVALDALESGLRELGWQRAAAGPDGATGLEVEVRDRGEHGVWLTGVGIELDGLARSIARASSRPVRHYSARIVDDPRGCQLELDGWTWWPDLRRVPIPGARDRDGVEPDDLAEGPAALVAAVLEVTAETHERWNHEDATIERWAVTRA